jgi:hypothetical protein
MTTTTFQIGQLIGKDGRLAGILSINDIVLRAAEGRGKQEPEIPYEAAARSKALTPGASLPVSDAVDDAVRVIGEEQ